MDHSTDSMRRSSDSFSSGQQQQQSSQQQQTQPQHLQINKSNLIPPPSFNRLAAFTIRNDSEPIYDDGDEDDYGTPEKQPNKNANTNANNNNNNAIELNSNFLTPANTTRARSMSQEKTVAYVDDEEETKPTTSTTLTTTNDFGKQEISNQLNVDLGYPSDSQKQFDVQALFTSRQTLHSAPSTTNETKSEATEQTEPTLNMKLSSTRSSTRIKTDENDPYFTKESSDSISSTNTNTNANNSNNDVPAISISSTTSSSNLTRSAPIAVRTESTVVNIPNPIQRRVTEHKYYSFNDLISGKNTLEETEIHMTILYQLAMDFGSKETIKLLLEAAESKDRKLKNLIEQMLESGVSDANQYTRQMENTQEPPEKYHWSKRFREANAQMLHEEITNSKSMEGIKKLIAVHRDFVNTAKT